MLRRRRLWLYLAGGLVVLAGAGVLVYFTLVKAPEDVRNDDVEFTEEEPAPPPPKARAETFVWPIYGYTPDRARYLPEGPAPPFRRIWQFNARDLLEYPPVLAKGTLYVINRSGTVFAVSAKNGSLKWQKKIGTENAASPAYANNRLYVPSFTDGLVALDARTGKKLWSKPIPDGTESGPLVKDGRIFLGSGTGKVYALNAKGGGEVWTHQADGPVKGALAFSEGRLYFGDYAGEVTAVRVDNGKPIWNTGTAGATFGRAGNFYGTPAVAFGRVYVGNTDGKVYSFSARTGDLAWTQTTGGFVYSAPSAAKVPGTKASVYIGSDDGNLYALDAKTGDVRFKFDAGGSIYGGVSTIGRIVYFSSFGGVALGVDAATGKRAFKLDSGRYASAISDGQRLYVTGYSSIQGYVPKGKPSQDEGGRDSRRPSGKGDRPSKAKDPTDGRVPDRGRKRRRKVPVPKEDRPVRR